MLFRSIILFGSSILLLLSCRSKTPNSIELLKADSLAFDIPDINIDSWSIIDSNSIVRYVFPFIHTYKRIIVCNENGRLQESIPLDSVLNIADIERVYFNSPDSIYAMTFYTNTVYLLNGKGIIVDKVRLTDSLYPSVSCKWEGFTNGQGLLNGQLVVKPNRVKSDQHVNLSYSNYLDSLSELTLSRPYFVIIKHLFSATAPSYSYELEHFLRRFMKRGNMAIDIQREVLIKGDTILLSSNFTDSVYMIYGDPLRVDHAVKIASEYSSISYPQVRIEDFAPDAINHMLLSHGDIKKICFDPFRQLYYVIVIHSQKRGKNDLSKKDYTWSIVFLDEHLKKLGEHFFPAGLYNFSSVLVHPKGLIVQKQGSAAITNTSVYDLFFIKK